MFVGACRLDPATGRRTILAGDGMIGASDFARKDGIFQLNSRGGIRFELPRRAGAFIFTHCALSCSPRSRGTGFAFLPVTDPAGGKIMRVIILWLLGVPLSVLLLLLLFGVL